MFSSFYSWNRIKNEESETRSGSNWRFKPFSFLLICENKTNDCSWTEQNWNQRKMFFSVWTFRLNLHIPAIFLIVFSWLNWIGWRSAEMDLRCRETWTSSSASSTVEEKTTIFWLSEHDWWRKTTFKDDENWMFIFLIMKDKYKIN